MGARGCESQTYAVCVAVVIDDDFPTALDGTAPDAVPLPAIELCADRAAQGLRLKEGGERMIRKNS